MIDVVYTFKVDSSVAFICDLNFQQMNCINWADVTSLMHSLEIGLLQLLRNNKESLQQVVLLGKSTDRSMV